MHRERVSENVFWFQSEVYAQVTAGVIVGPQWAVVIDTLALPEEVEHWSLTTLRDKLVKIGARIVRHGRYVVFQLAEVAVPRALFAEILRRIERLRPRPPPFSA